MPRSLTALLVACFAIPLVATSSRAAVLQPMTVKAAYDEGLITISVEIAPADKRGDHLQMRIETNDKPLTIMLSTETTSLAMEKPFENLVFRSAAAQKLDLTAERPANLVVNQVGVRRFVEAKFQIATDDGKPQFVGSAKVDNVK